jgi:hypothetical protein
MVETVLHVIRLVFIVRSHTSLAMQDFGGTEQSARNAAVLQISALVESQY